MGVATLIWIAVAVRTCSANVQIPSAQPDQPTESAENLRTQAFGYFKALTIMDMAIKQFPDDAANYQWRGQFYTEMHNFPPALAYLAHRVG